MPIRSEAEAGQGGFTLIEVLVAIAVLGLVMVAVMRMASTGLNGLELSRDYTMATIHAESLLAQIGVVEPLAAGERAGRVDERFAWRWRMAPVAAARDAAGGTAAVAYEILVEVSWRNGDDERAVSLSTVRLQSAL